MKIDISGYFETINHQKLLLLLRKRFKGQALINQFIRILDSHHDRRGYGLPIGSLTSQYFANYYLDGFDRWLSAQENVRANLRYMDDMVWWTDSREQAVKMLKAAKRWLQDERELWVKPSAEIIKSQSGVSYCGFRITQGALRLSRRRKRRYQ